ncbi:transposase [Kitasatospora sp. NPDC101235]|uniref:transposase n=1 Tax=Kitasatospora sp. NPDC101235 TaxID=3364101 RepID=UPI0037F51937
MPRTAERPSRDPELDQEIQNLTRGRSHECDGTGVQRDPFAELSRFRADFYDCLTGRRDVLFELTDALLCTEGPVKTLVGLALAPEYRRGHGALYGALNKSRLDVDRLWRTLAGLPLPRAADGRPLVADRRRPWERPAEPNKLTPAHVRRGFRNLQTKVPSPPRAPKPTLPGPGRPPRTKNRCPTRRPDVGRVLATGEAYARPTHHGKGTKPRRTTAEG